MEQKIFSWLEKKITRADKKLISYAKRQYGMSSSKLVESIASAWKLSFLVLGDVLLKVQ